MEYLFIYLLQVAENLMLVFIAALLAAVFSGVAWGFMVSDNNNGAEYDTTGVKRVCISGLVCMLSCLAMPNKQTLLLMGGTYLGKKAVAQVVQSEKLQKVSEIIDLKLDKLIKENQ